MIINYKKLIIITIIIIIIIIIIIHTYIHHDKCPHLGIEVTMIDFYTALKDKFSTIKFFEFPKKDEFET